MKKIKNSGFSLIETIIYTSLFSIIIFISINSLYNLIEGSEKNRNVSKIEMESIFINQKIDSVIDKDTDITISNYGKTITIQKLNPEEGYPIVISEINNNILLSRENNTAVILNNENYKITDLNFEKNETLNKLKLIYKINNTDFEFIKYIKN